MIPIKDKRRCFCGLNRTLNSWLSAWWRRARRWGRHCCSLRCFLKCLHPTLSAWLSRHLGVKQGRRSLCLGLSVCFSNKEISKKKKKEQGLALPTWTNCHMPFSSKISGDRNFVYIREIIKVNSNTKKSLTLTLCQLLTLRNRHSKGTCSPWECRFPPHKSCLNMNSISTYTYVQISMSWEEGVDSMANAMLTFHPVSEM